MALHKGFMYQDHALPEGSEPGLRSGHTGGSVNFACERCQEPPTGSSSRLVFEPWTRQGLL